jgi:tripartite-type tricarboxylate transporter receptor subunit TctC
MNYFVKILLASVLAIGSVSASATAKQPIEIIIPTAPGGTTDLIGRFVAKTLSDSGMPAVAVNKPGAQMVVAGKYVTSLKDKEKNNTLLMMTAGGSLASWLPEPKPYDIFKELDPITLLAKDSIVVVVPAESKFKTVPELVNEMRARPGQLTYATGSMSHIIAADILLNATKTSGINVAYQGQAPANVALGGNQVDFAVVSYADSKELAMAGRFRIIGISANHRVNDGLNVPTLKEQGIVVPELNVWYALLAPAGMNPALIKQINKLIVPAIEKEKHTHARLKLLNAGGSTPAELTQFMRSYYNVWNPYLEKTRTSGSK